MLLMAKLNNWGKLSGVIPAYNEEGNVVALYEEFKSTAEGMIKSGRISSYEVVFTDDGSTDKTLERLVELKKREKDRVKIVVLRKNSGQTAGLHAGFQHVSGDLIATMDADRQNDPKDIPKLLDEMEKGYDVVSGWRWNRKDKFGKRVASKIMNKFRKSLVGDNLHDYGCSLKLYKKECIKDLELMGELHRYITAYLYIKGYKIGEVKVNHRARVSGVTKYKFNRGVNGVMDLLFLKFWSSFSDRPLHLFGRLGIYQWILAVLLVIEQIVKAVMIDALHFGPVLALAGLLVVTGTLSIIFGFLFEMLSRLYFDKGREPYLVKNVY
jgi:glycosyltransferase involved in cell wall biosynthesis